MYKITKMFCYRLNEFAECSEGVRVNTFAIHITSQEGVVIFIFVSIIGSENFITRETCMLEILVDWASGLKHIFLKHSI